MACCGKLDMQEVREEFAGEADRKNRAAVYGIDRKLMPEIGPSVVSLNGLIASAAITEFMVAITGLRKPNRAFTYWGHTGKTSLSAPLPRPDCYTCSLWGKRWDAQPEQYLETG
jgi:molybdopterin-synthase adenylyltransferase